MFDWLAHKKILTQEMLVITGAVCLVTGLAFFSAYLPWYIILGGFILVCVAIVALRNPLYGLLLLVFFLPFERLGTYELSGLTVRISQIMLIITIAAWGLRLFWQRSRLALRNPLLIPLGLFLVIIIFSLTNSLNMQRSLLVLAFTIFTLSLAWLVPLLITDKKTAQRVTRVFLISFVLVSIFGIYQFAGDMTGLPTTLTGLRDMYTKQVLGFTRVQSTAFEPLYFANYLLVPLAILFALFLSGKNVIKSGWLIILFGLGMINLILTVSRGAYLAIAATLLVVALFYLRKIFTLRNIIVFIVAGLAVGWVVVKTLGVGGDLFAIEKFQGHVTNVFYGASYNERIATFEDAVTAWREHPLIGIGVGSFGPYEAPHPEYVPKDGWKIVNNEFLELLAETGILGLFFFVVFIAFLLVRTLKAIITTQDSYLRALLVGLLGAFVGILVQYQTFSTLYIMHVWFVVGFLIAVQNIAFQEHASIKSV